MNEWQNNLTSFSSSFPALSPSPSLLRPLPSSPPTPSFPAPPLDVAVGTTTGTAATFFFGLETAGAGVEEVVVVERGGGERGRKGKGGGREETKIRKDEWKFLKYGKNLVVKEDVSRKLTWH